MIILEKDNVVIRANERLAKELKLRGYKEVKKKEEEKEAKSKKTKAKK